MHRYILNIKDENIDVDHIDHDTLNNKKYNLKVSDKELNAKNRLGANKNTTSGERNVCWVKGDKVWRVQLQINGKNKVFGNFSYDNLDAAIALARQRRKEFYNQ